MNPVRELRDIDLNKKLTDVKRQENGSGVFICPASCAEVIQDFLAAYEIPYTSINDPKLYPKSEIDTQLTKYIDTICPVDDLAELKELESVTVILSEFDPDALFKWALQVLSYEDRDPAYQEYLDNKRQQADAYYAQNE